MTVVTKHILLVGGEASLRLALKSSLERLHPDYQVVTASDGSVALGRLLQQSFDLILADCQLYDMDGPELVEAVHEISPQTRLLLLVDQATYLLTEPVKFLELNDYIEKSFTSMQMMQIIEQVMSQ